MYEKINVRFAEYQTSWPKQALHCLHVSDTNIFKTSRTSLKHSFFMCKRVPKPMCHKKAAITFTCIQQRKTTCLLSIRKSLACARGSKLTPTNMYITRARCESQPAVGSSGMTLADHREFKFLRFCVILDSSVGLSAGIKSAGDLLSETLGSNPTFSRGGQLDSYRFENRLPVPEPRN